MPNLKKKTFQKDMTINKAKEVEKSELTKEK